MNLFMTGYIENAQAVKERIKTGQTSPKMLNIIHEKITLKTKKNISYSSPALVIKTTGIGPNTNAIKIISNIIFSLKMVVVGIKYHVKIKKENLNFIWS